MWNHLPDDIVAFSHLPHGGYWEDEAKWVGWNQFEFHQLVHWTNWFSSLLIFLLFFCEYICTRHELTQFKKGDKDPQSLSVLWHVVSITKAEDHTLCPIPSEDAFTLWRSDFQVWRVFRFHWNYKFNLCISSKTQPPPPSFAIMYSLGRWLYSAGHSKALSKTVTWHLTFLPLGNRFILVGIWSDKYAECKWTPRSGFARLSALYHWNVMNRCFKYFILKVSSWTQV